MASIALADLHTHTYYSDGGDSPERVIHMAKDAGLSAIAITDHDILDGHPEAAEAAKRHGLELVPGIEMSAAVKDIEVHVLGFFIDGRHAALQALLAEQRDRRMRRMHDMVGKLQAIGLSITVEDVMAVAGKGTMGRPHVAEALVRRKHVATLREAFDRYIGANGPAFIPGSSLAPKTVIQLIRQAGGVPVLAHPMYLKNDNLIDEFVRDGLVGLEVYHSSHTPELVKRYEQIAKRLGLLMTGGTDYHGKAKEGLPIGSTTVPYSLVDGLKQWKLTHAPTSA